MGIFDDLILLRSFVSIVENGSISAAARSLRLPQPTISRHLASLEEKCDVALLRRDTHTMSLTEARPRLLSDAKAMLLLAEESDLMTRARGVSVGQSLVDEEDFADQLRSELKPLGEPGC